ncbi:MAG: hypothetical protein A2W99_08575 [Bacteroidetes bacterium GWF2_33_16]|nr:MAG: hypothetical protein A2X00_00580 [Bacteroidetes bacterium GWE2_32_14]OFY05555.1 MAG: hypothetical protein A2W99_08575 [Bacteroidetes bacterium GWF2_33_16]
MRLGILFSILIFSTLFTKGQSYSISGKIKDQKTKESLPFVHISYGEKGIGTTSNIDGNFEIKSDKEVTRLIVSYLGYFSDTIIITEYPNPRNLAIEMIPTSYNIEAAIILPGINPAHRIINKVIENRDINNPEKMQSFSYKSYNKMHFTARKDTSEIPDSLIAKTYTIDRKLEQQHLLIMETVNEKKFKYPYKASEQIIASKVSGFSDPIFSLIASQIQSFSFYNDYFVIFDKMYINPISKGSTNRYLFMIEDTLYAEPGDTIFVVSYRPKKDKIFDGLKGFLQINTNGYAIQSVVAEPLEKDFGMMVNIKQNYEFVNNQQWFPKELHTEIIFDKALKANDKITYQILAVGRSYISDINLNPEFNNKEFSQVEVKIHPNATEKSDTFWNENRIEPLYKKDSLTYVIIDSISKAENFEKILVAYESILNGYIPYKFIHFPINRIIDYNIYEGWRLGFGFMTNHKLSSVFEFGGYLGYGFTDKAFKYGGDLLFNIHKNSESKIRFSYSNDVVEKAGFAFFEKLDLMTTELYRKYIVTNMDKIEKQEVTFSFRSMDYLNTNIFFRNEIIESTDGYIYESTLDDADNQFTFTEVGLQFKYAFKEKFLQTQKYNYSMGTDYPVVYANITQGINFYKGEFEYTKYELKIVQSFRTKSLGKTKLTLIGGLVDGKVPLSKLYNGHANNHNYDLDAENSFATMGMNEFYNDRFVSFFFRQEFGSFFRIKSFSPKFVLASNFGIGEIDFNPKHQSVKPIQSVNKGYYESGILVNNILTQQFIGIGFGVYYRYGSYSYIKTADNFAYKFTFTINL